MSQPRSRSILAQILKNFINSIKPRQFKGDLKGTDYNGTKYYEIPADYSVGRSRTSRWFKPAEGGEDSFDQDLPAEWEAWLRGRRKHPPTEEEVLRNLELMKIKKLNAIEVEKKAGKPKQLDKGMESFPKRSEYEYMPGNKPKE